MFIPARFCGPTESGNGGYVCGRLANHLSGCAVVRLMAPPPLETELRVEATATQAKLFHGSRIIAAARVDDLALVPPARPSFAEARQAARSYAGAADHPFPRCFVCGPNREVGDGLRIFPGSVASAPIVAAPWVPDLSLADAAGRVRPEFLWAALDCPGYFAVMPKRESGMTAVLGELCARIDAVVEADKRYVVIGWSLGEEGRKRYAGSAILSATGDTVALARATWIEVAASAFESESA